MALEPEQKTEIKKRLEGIRADIESRKITFADAADKYSQDPVGRPKGGDIGQIARTQISVKQLGEAIFSTAPGLMTPVVEGPQGFHLVNVMEIKPSGKPSFVFRRGAQGRLLCRAKNTIHSDRCGRDGVSSAGFPPNPYHCERRQTPAAF